MGKHTTSEGDISGPVDPQRVQTALRDIPGDEIVNALAETFRALSDPTRVRIVAALAHQEMSVSELAEVLGVTGSAVSHQLRLLRGQRLVKYRKQGKVVYYELDDPHISNLLAEGVRHVT
jgi:ArsR family transcriptional regulator, lead/cadmium/zinc/bismuth-responsive transcriptional repressor